MTVFSQERQQLLFAYLDVFQNFSTQRSQTLNRAPLPLVAAMFGWVCLHCAAASSRGDLDDPPTPALPATHC
jgi:hypothetical protein